MTRRPLLGAYAAKQCPFRLFREHDPTEPARPAEPDGALQALFDDGIAFEADIAAEIVERHGDLVVVVPGRDAAEHERRRELTDAALAAGTPIILGALMQHDVEGRRLGEIDVLVSTGVTTPTGKIAYLPLDVKSHRCTINKEAGNKEAGNKEAGNEEATNKEASENEAGDAPDQLVHDLGLLGDHTAVEGLAPKYREDDCLQLAHYVRLLEAHGHAPAFAEGRPVWGGIIGMERVVAWFDLNRPAFNTITPQERTATDGSAEVVYHRRHRTTQRTALDRYDYEFAFRLRMVDAALARTDRAEPAEVLPVSVKECDRCPWHDPCHDDLRSVDDVSLVSPVRYPEWRVHRFIGTTTATQLAGLDLPTAQAMRDLTADELDDRAERLDAATMAYVDTPITPTALVKQIECARSAVAGSPIVQPGWDPNSVPRGDVEIDLDLENADRVYLWGARLSKVPSHWPEQTGSYVAFSSFDELDDAGEAELVGRLWRWLDDLRSRAAHDGLAVRIYGYSMNGTEGAQLRRVVAGRSDAGLPTSEDIEALIGSSAWVDLLPYMRQKFWSNQGHGLKVVAVASGFAWRDDDPGGYASIGWYDAAVAGIDRDANIQRLLTYNEDDCAATAALRDPIG